MTGGGSVERTGDRLCVRGPVTMANVESLLQQGRSSMQDGAVTTIDLSGVAEVDSSSVSMLLQWTREAQARGQRIVIAHMPENIGSLATLYGVNALLPSEQPETTA